MFRANRIGTPNITGNQTESSSDFLTTAVHTQADPPEFCVVNAIPWSDFGSNTVEWNGNATGIPSGEYSGIGQQFTVDEPLAGNVPGVEIIGNVHAASITSGLRFVLQPYFCKLVAAASSVGAPVVSDLTQDTYVDWKHTYVEPSSAAIFGISGVTYKTQVIIDGQVGLLPGTYLHGVRIRNMFITGPGVIEDISASFAVRQLNDQQDIGYRDTRR